MKKFLLSFAALTAVSMGVMASETVATLAFSTSNTAQTSVSSYTDTWTTTVDGYGYSITGFNNNKNAWAYVKCGRKTNASVASIVNTSAFSASIDEIILSAKSNTATNPGVNSAKIYVLDNAEDANADAVATYDFTDDFNALTNAQADVKVALTSPVANRYYKIVIDMPNTYTANGQYWLYSVKYNGTGGVELKDPEIKFPASEYSAEIGKAFESPKATSLSSGAITYSSSNTKAATVDAATGEVTLLFPGTTEITATVAGDGTYKADDAVYTLVVTDPSSIYASAMGDDFTFEDEEEFEAWKHDSTYGLKASGYASGASNVSDSYAISPVIDLTSCKNITLNFKQALNNFKVSGSNIELSEAVKYCTVAVREEGATSWTDLGSVTAAEGTGSWTFYDNDPVDLNAYAGKKIQVAFRYTSETTCAGTWELNSIMVSGEKDTNAVDAIEIEENDAPVEYYNLQGVRVANPENGLYIKRQGDKVSKVIL